MNSFRKLIEQFYSAECQPHPQPSPECGTPTSVKRQSKKKTKLDRKPSAGAGEKNEVKAEDQKLGSAGGSLVMDLQGTTSLPSTPTPQPIQSQLSPMAPANSHDSKALQVAALTHALSCMKKFQDPIPGRNLKF